MYMAAMTSCENTQFITGDCFQPRPRGFCLPFFKGKVLDTRLNCFIPLRASAALQPRFSRASATLQPRFSHASAALQPRTPLKSSPALRLFMSYARKRRKCILCLSMTCDFADQFETSTSPRGIPRAFNYFGCSDSGEFGKLGRNCSAKRRNEETS